MIGRVVAVVSMTIAALPLSMGVAHAPPLDYDGGNFQPYAQLDTDQVIDPGPCTLVKFKYNGWLWTYCKEDPTDVQPYIPFANQERK